MAVQTRILEWKAKFAGGLLLPASPGVGKVLISDGEGNGRWSGQLVSELPGSPVDGDMVYYQNAAMAEAGVVWHLRFRSGSASAHKWEYIGGGRLSNITTGGEKVVTAEKWETFGSPKLTLPLAGDYEIQHNCTLITNVATNPTMIAGISVAGAEPFVASRAQATPPAFVGARSTIDWACLLANATAGQTLEQQYFSTAAQTVQNSRAALRVAPIRVG